MIVLKKGNFDCKECGNELDQYLECTECSTPHNKFGSVLNTRYDLIGTIWDI